jgi:hypothetical protein
MSTPSAFRRRADRALRAFALTAAAIAVGSCDVVVPSGGAPSSFLKAIGGALDEQGNVVRQTSDGGFIIAGSTESSGAGLRDLYLVKTSAGGEIEWERSYGGANNDEARDVIQLDDGGYLAVGTTLSFALGSTEAYLVRTDAHGDTLWTRAIGGSSVEYAASVVPATGGGFLIAGATNRATPGGVGYDAFMIRMTPEGDTLWTKTIAGGQEEHITTAVPIPDGYLLAGHIRPAGTPPGPPNVYVVRVDANGVRVGTPYFNVSWKAELRGAVVHDGKLLAVGYQQKGDETENVMAMQLSYDNRARIVLDTIRTYGREGGNFGNACAIASDGNLVVLGSSKGFGRNEDYYLLKLETASRAMPLLWSYGFGGANADAGRSVVVARDGGIVMVGTAGSFVDGHNGSDIMLIKVNAAGELRE